MDWIPALVLASLYNATPLVLAALGGVLSERSGLINIALEGMMLAAAFVGVCCAGVSPVVGLVAAVAVGGCLGLAHGWVSQRWRVNQIISGLAINLLAAGGTQYLAQRLFPSGVQVATLPKGLFLGLAAALPLVVAWCLRNTRGGLRLRAVGDDPFVAHMAGIATERMRYAAVALAGALCGLAGAYLSLADAGSFSRDMTAGKGYIALAAVVFGRWDPVRASAGALLFGFCYAVETQLQIANLHARLFGVDWSNPTLLDAAPYLVTILALVLTRGTAGPPAGLGKMVEASE